MTVWVVLAYWGMGWGSPEMRIVAIYGNKEAADERLRLSLIAGGPDDSFEVEEWDVVQ